MKGKSMTRKFLSGVCGICGVEQNRLRFHVMKTHNLEMKDYFDLYMKKESDGLCKECGNPTSWRKGETRYLDFCSVSCSSRYRWKNNPELYDNMRIAASESLKMRRLKFENDPIFRKNRLEWNKKGLLKMQERRNYLLTADTVEALQFREKVREIGHQVVEIARIALENNPEALLRRSEHCRELNNRIWKEKDPKYADYREQLIESSLQNIKKAHEKYKRLWVDLDPELEEERIRLREISSLRGTENLKKYYSHKRHEYNGIMMRSGWETEFAGELDTRGIAWQYEPQTFKMQTNEGHYVRYTPDFFLPNAEVYVEIKPVYFLAGKVKEKCDLFRSLGHKYLILTENNWNEVLYALDYSSLGS